MVKRLLLSSLMAVTVASTSVAEVTYLFAHGLGGHAKDAQAYNAIANKQKIVAFNFPDAKDGKFMRGETSLAQGHEIERLNKRFQSTVKKNADAEVVLLGVSRGASTIINFMGKQKPAQVKALVLESPFAYAEDIKFGYVPSVIGGIIRPFIYRKYSYEGDHPAYFARAINKNTPVLLICSKEDKFVPMQSTVALYERLLMGRHAKAHLLVLEKGEHGKLLSGEEGTEYQNVVHAFYKHYDLPHDAKLAAKGKKLFAKTQPERNEINKMLERAEAKKDSKKETK